MMDQQSLSDYNLMETQGLCIISKIYTNVKDAATESITVQILISAHKPPVLHYEVFRPKGYSPNVSSFNKDAHKDATKFTS